MDDFLIFYNKVYYEKGFQLNIGHSSITDWCIKIGYKTTHSKRNKIICDIQECDMQLAFAKAQIALKEYMSKEYEGY